MSGVVAKYVGKKILGETVANRFGQEDPYFERVPASEMHSRPNSNKVKKRKKQNPRGMSDHDVKIFNRAKRRAYRLDECLFSCCGVRFGWSSVIGFIPVAGDIIDAFLAYTYVVLPLRKLNGGLPGTLQRRMEMNIVLDFLVGLVPFLGDVADAVFRANTRNVILIEKHFERLALENEEKLTGGDAGAARLHDRQNRSRDPSREPRRPEPAVQPASKDTRSGRGGWFGGRLEAPAPAAQSQAQAPVADPGLETGVAPTRKASKSGNGKLQRDPSRRENRDEQRTRRF